MKKKSRFFKSIKMPFILPLVGFLTFAIISVFYFKASAQSPSKNSHWSHSNSNYKSEKFSSLKSINIENLSNLEVAWEFKSGFITETNNTVQSTPIFTGRSVITVSLDGSLLAINPETGIEIWRTKFAKPVARRGIVYTNFSKPTLFISTGEGVVAVNEMTGEIDKTVGKEGFFGAELSLLPPVITDSSVIVAHNWTGIKSYDLKTGKEKWHAVIKSGNIVPRIWSGYSFDKSTGLLFFVTSNPGSLVGIQRKSTKDYSSSLIAVDSGTGKIVWSFQEIAHDLWDLEMVGSPIILDFKLNGKIKKAIFSFSKTGNVIALDRLTGEPIYPKSYVNITVPKSDVPGEKSALTQKLFTNPEPISKTTFDPKIDLQNIDKKRREYIDFKMRNAKTGFYVPPSLNNDVVMFGLHGGAEWPGGTLDAVNSQIIIPLNRNPWILRLYYSDKIFAYINKKLNKYNFGSQSSNAPANHKARLSQGAQCSSCHASKARWDQGAGLTPEKMSLSEKIYSKISYFSGNGMYLRKCSSCHGVARQGFYENEFFGDGYAPSLVGLTLTGRKKSMNSVQAFNNNHKYTSIQIDLAEIELIEIRDYFTKSDKFLERWDLLSIQGKWQLLLDQDDLPATQPPWGQLAAIDLETGKINWKTPFGQRKIPGTSKVIFGDINFGGVLSTSSGLVFATGTPDEMARAFNSKTGEELWAGKLPAAGSAPPMTYEFKGCQYVIFTATGGRFVGYGTRSDSTVAFKLNTCGKRN